MHVSSCAERFINRVRASRRHRGATVPLPVELERMQDCRDFLPQVPHVDAVVG